jgi:hypothetical protein
LTHPYGFLDAQSVARLLRPLEIYESVSFHFVEQDQIALVAFFPTVEFSAPSDHPFFIFCPDLIQYGFNLAYHSSQMHLCFDLELPRDVDNIIWRALDT